MCAEVRFENLKCSVKKTTTGIPKCLLPSQYKTSETKTILNSINGNFRGGKLTAILGTSGAGKTTLLNILAGYLKQGVTGDIYINGIKQTGSDLKRHSTYIAQDILVQPFLTVHESLTIAADLKLHASGENKRQTVERVITTLGLGRCSNTRSEYLSGGEKKRLSIALELISDPGVLFLDEPSSGLDEVSMKLCVELMKKLSFKGKTVICTIHQPSNTVLHLFDDLYIMDNGSCIFNGTPDELIPFLSSANFPCPTTYNPADYILEISQENNDHRTALIENAKRIESLRHRIPSTSSDLLKSEKITSKVPFTKQLSILLYRHFLQLFRNNFNIILQCFHFVLCALLLGGTYFGMGQDAKYSLYNFLFCLIVVVYLTFGTSLPPALSYPLEFQLFKGEIFNGWYNINAYFVSLMLVSLPIPVIMSVVFTAITYFMTDQPNEIDRFIKVCLILIVTVIISDTHGKTVAVCFNVFHSSIVSPATFVPITALAFYGFGYADQVGTFMKVLMQFSFVRYSLVGVMGAIYNNRQEVPCYDIYCHYSEPKVFLYDMGMNGVYEIQILALILFLILYKCVMYTFLRIRTI